MIELDFKGADPLQVKRNLVKKFPYMVDKIKGFTDENGRNYLEIDDELICYTEPFPKSLHVARIKQVINQTILEQLQIKGKEQPMPEEKPRFTFASVMEREIKAELDSELSGSRRDMIAFKADLEAKKAELQKVVDEYKAEAAKKLAEIDTLVKASEIAQEKKMDGKLAPILDNIRVILAFVDKLRAFYRGL